MQCLDLSKEEALLKFRILNSRSKSGRENDGRLHTPSGLIINKTFFIRKLSVVSNLHSLNLPFITLFVFVNLPINSTCHFF